MLIQYGNLFIKVLIGGLFDQRNPIDNKNLLWWWSLRLKLISFLSELYTDQKW